MDAYLMRKLAVMGVNRTFRNVRSIEMDISPADMRRVMPLIEKGYSALTDKLLMVEHEYNSLKRAEEDARAFLETVSKKVEANG